MVKMILATPDGAWHEYPSLNWAGRRGGALVKPTAAELMPLPAGATLTMLPGRRIAGQDAQGHFLLLPEHSAKGKSWCGVAALLPQGFTRTLLPAVLDGGDTLPLLGYCAVGVDRGQLVVAARRTDEHKHWHPRLYNTADLPKLIKKVKRLFPSNRMIAQLAHCASEYGCFTAQNIFYCRYEAGLPVSPACNANCVGCISLQPSQCCPSPQQRIKTPPTLKEVSEVAIRHLSHAPQAIVSFGQGCEGEPSLQADLIAASIKEIRAHTSRGVINMNTNAGYTRGLGQIIAAGIDSLRVSMISAIPEVYQRYHRPVDYSFDDVCRSLSLARGAGVFVSINLLAYPGLSDKPEEIAALTALASEYGVRQIQLRNLNIDPAVMTKLYGNYLSGGLGVPSQIEAYTSALPGVLIGNYSRHDI